MSSNLAVRAFYPVAATLSPVSDNSGSSGRDWLLQKTVAPDLTVDTHSGPKANLAEIAFKWVVTLV